MFKRDIDLCIEFGSTPHVAKKSLSGAASHFFMITLLLIYMIPNQRIDVVACFFIAGIIGFNIFRAVICLRMQKFDERRWHRYLIVSVLGTSLSWALTAIYVLIEFKADADLTLMMILMLGGMAAASTASLVPHRSLAILFVLMMATPPIIGMVASNNHAWILISLSFVIYSALMITLIRAHTIDFWRLQRRDREVEKHTQQLTQSEKQAREASQLKSDFLSTMSHEIRTPINAIIGLSELLIDTQSTPLQAKYHRTLRNSGESLLLVINDILDFSKIESGKLSIETIEFSLVKMVEHQLEIITGTASEKGLTLGLHVDPDLPERVMGDPVRIGQIILNLLSNAVKFTEKGRVDLRVSGQRQGARLNVKIDVVDTGIGLSEEAQTRLFNPFTQADSSTSRRFGGTGLGLSISLRLIEMMGGTIGVRSFEGLGSTFSIEIPFDVAVEKTLGQRKKIAGDQARQRIWVVESDRRALESCLLYLRSWGWKADVIQAKDIASIPAGDERSLIIINKREFSATTESSLVTAVAASRGTLKVLVTGVQMELMPAINETLQTSVSTLTMPLRPSEFFDAVADALYDKNESNVLPLDSNVVSLVDPNLLPASLRILVAEDNATNQLLITALLKKMGCDAKVVGTGAEALLALSDQVYDVILMDCQMPEMDGYQATQAIREGEKSSGRHLPIIALTANAMKEDRQRCLDMGMDDYLAKPVRRNELCQALKKWSVNVA